MWKDENQKKEFGTGMQEVIAEKKHRAILLCWPRQRFSYAFRPKGHGGRVVRMRGVRFRNMN
jgi:hypothetical protein